MGNTVDVIDANWSDTICATEMITVWKDPDFDGNPRVFFYVWVIESPTPRWTAYDAGYWHRRGYRNLDHQPGNRFHLTDLEHPWMVDLGR